MNFSLRIKRKGISFILITSSQMVWGQTSEEMNAALLRGDWITSHKIALKLASRGDGEAKSILGDLYSSGRGVTKDYKEAVKWYRLAAYQGYAYAQVSLAFAYAIGRGVLQDYERAHMWFNLARMESPDVLPGISNTITNLEREMSISQIAEAQKLARECLAKKYVGCE